MNRRKYELTGETTVLSTGETVHRIRALTDIVDAFVRKGDEGGWVESECLLDGSARIADDAWVGEEAAVVGQAQISENAHVFDCAVVSGRARIHANARVYGSAMVSGNAEVSGYAQVSGNARVYGDAQLDGETWVGEEASIYDRAHIADDAHVLGNSHVHGTAQICGGSRIRENADISGDARIYATISGNAKIESAKDIVTLGPIGPDPWLVSLYPTKDGNHEINLVNWVGTLGTLEQEISRRQKKWTSDAETRTRWSAEYQALKAIVKNAVANWASET